VLLADLNMIIYIKCRVHSSYDSAHSSIHSFIQFTQHLQYAVLFLEDTSVNNTERNHCPCRAWPLSVLVHFHYSNKIPQTGKCITKRGLLSSHVGGSRVWHWPQFRSGEDPLAYVTSWSEYVWEERSHLKTRSQKGCGPSIPSVDMILMDDLRTSH
jgi:hypothetical protein